VRAVPDKVYVFSAAIKTLEERLIHFGAYNWQQMPCCPLYHLDIEWKSK
jgi:hypothetical protein